MPVWTDTVDGKSKSYIPLSVTGVPSTYPGFLGYEVVSGDWVNADGSLDPNEYIHTGYETAEGPLPYPIEVDTPARVMAVTFWARSCFQGPNGAVLKNPIVRGVTPSCTVTLGTTDGVIDISTVMPETLANGLKIATGQLAIDFNGTEMQINPSTHQLEIKGVPLDKAIAETVGAALAVSGGVLGVAPSGITEALVAQYAINNTHIKRVGVDKLAVVDADIVSLAAAKITAGTLAAGVVYAGTIQANQIAAGTLAAGVVYAGSIATSQIAAGTLGAGVIYAGNIAATQITAGTLAAGVVYAGSISATQVTAGDFTGRALTLNRDGLEVSINVATDGSYVRGVAAKNTSGSYGDRRILLGDSQVWGVGHSGMLNFALINNSIPGFWDYGQLNLYYGGTDTVKLNASTGSADVSTEYRVNGTKVIGARYGTRPTTLADVISLLVYHGLSA